MSCLLCTNAVAMHVDRMFAHVKHVHGHTFGNPQTKEEIVNKVKELKIKRYETHPNHVVALLCGVCRTHSHTQFDSLVHLCSHTSIAEQCHYCLFETVLTHHLSQHGSFFRSNLSYPVLKNCTVQA